MLAKTTSKAVERLTQFALKGVASGKIRKCKLIKVIISETKTDKERIPRKARKITVTLSSVK